MKRGADAMDAGDSARGERNDNRGWKRPEQDHKRMRRADEGRNHDGGAGAKGAEVRTLADEKEADPHRLAQRQKQIDYGKNTIGYDLYCAQVPRHQRRPGRHPTTPDKTKKMGKKVFDGIVRKWRQALHKYDPPELAEAATTTVIKVTPPESIGGRSKADVKEKSSAVMASSSASTTTSAEPGATKETASLSALVPSIYENFDEDNFDEEDSDDDLL
uniref:Histone RNA hairpin-binding protein RNA-binding domain-containing protein n=1 Tax=Phytophthora ramorum TaxID=164328 RepID=H3GRU1_PHYRM